MMSFPRLLGAVLAACCCLIFVGTAAAQSSAGACCLPSGQCVLLAQCDCEMQGGGFGGVGSSCVGFNCQVFRFGACCTVTGCANTTQALCSAFPGTFAFGLTCGAAGVPCPPMLKACCCGTSCYLTDATLCSHQGGTQLPATSCTPNPCIPSTSGACCDVFGNCTIVSGATACQGQFLGVGTTCTPNPCTPIVGACCDSAGNCTLVSSPAACVGTFLGAGTVCNPNPCPGACCDSAGNCTQTTVTACQGSFLVGSCTPNPCPPKVCCDPATGNCQLITPCPAGWTQAVGPCTATLCPVPQFNGVCCDFLGNCIPWVLGTACNGQILTNTTSCSPNPCMPLVCCDPLTGLCSALPASGACPTGWTQVTGPCTPNNPCPTSQGVCCDLQNNCFLLAIGAGCNGTIFPNLTSCNPNPCPQMACCTAAGGCFLVANSAQCTGQLFPNLASCTPNPCVFTVCCDPATGICVNVTPCPPGNIVVPGPCSPLVACGPSGVCCDAAGNCFPMVGGVTCNGTIFPNLSSCTPNPCIPNGACCQPCSGACSTTTPANCPSPYTYFPGAPCQPGVCPTTPVFGKCCLNQTCITATSCDCVLKGGTFSGAVPCSPNLCAGDGPGACCHNGSCTIMSAGTCAQVGGTSAIGVSCAAAFPNCTSPVSVCCCCGLCHILDAQACAIAGGTVAVGTACTPLSCFPNGGACCNPATGACFAVANSSQCTAPFVFFLGQPCTPAACVQTGSCCDVCTGTCTVITGAQCPTTFQIYTAGGTCLPPATCIPTCGACCTNNAAGQPFICTLVQAQTVCTGIWQGVGSTCVPNNPCIPPNATCCNNATGVCQVFANTSTCPFIGWTLQPTGTPCFPNPCPIFGACCQQGAVTCTTTVQTACNGQWFANSSCNPNPCVRVCCNVNTGQCGVLGFGLVCPVNTIGVAGTTCTPSPCPPLGACCISGTILCTTTFQSNCNNGTWFPGGTCNPNPCVKACCNPSTGGCVQVFSGSACPVGATPVLTGITCTPNPCPPVAPCCTQPNGCIITTQAACLAGPFPGLWGPVGASCNIICSRACCNNTTGACTTTGVFGICPPNSTPIGLVCTPSPCPPMGRCCTFPGGCTITVQTACNGIWGPAGSTCTTNPCVHACCNTQTGACIIAPIYAFCFGPWVNIVNTTCTPNPCPPVNKPCCLANGSCVINSPSACALVGGTVQTTATSCATVVCRGACCLPPNAIVCGVPSGTHCVLTSQSQCTGTWNGYGSVCAVPATSTNYTTCCRANINGIGGVTVADIFAFLSAWFSGCTGQAGPPCNGINADFNCDGFVNVADIFAFLNAWFVGCS